MRNIPHWHLCHNCKSLGVLYILARHHMWDITSACDSCNHCNHIMVPSQPHAPSISPIPTSYPFLMYNCANYVHYRGHGYIPSHSWLLLQLERAKACRGRRPDSIGGCSCPLCHPVSCHYKCIFWTTHQWSHIHLPGKYHPWHACSTAAAREETLCSMRNFKRWTEQHTHQLLLLKVGDHHCQQN